MRCGKDNRGEETGRTPLTDGVRPRHAREDGTHEKTAFPIWPEAGVKRAPAEGPSLIRRSRSRSHGDAATETGAGLGKPTLPLARALVFPFPGLEHHANTQFAHKIGGFVVAVGHVPATAGGEPEAARAEANARADVEDVFFQVLPIVTQAALCTASTPTLKPPPTP